MQSFESVLHVHCDFHVVSQWYFCLVKLSPVSFRSVLCTVSEDLWLTFSTFLVMNGFGRSSDSRSCCEIVEFRVGCDVMLKILFVTRFRILLVFIFCFVNVLSLWWSDLFSFLFFFSFPFFELFNSVVIIFSVIIYCVLYLSCSPEIIAMVHWT